MLQLQRLRRQARAVALAAALVALSAFAVACGSSNDDDNATTSASTPTMASGAVAQQAQQLVGEATSGLVYATGDRVDPAQIKPLASFQGPRPTAPPSGRAIKLAIVACAPIGGCLNVSNNVAAIARKLGWQVTQSAGDGTPSSYQKLYDTALTQHVDAIVGVAVPGIAVAAQLADARSKGVVTIHSNGVPTSGPGYTGYVDAREALSKTLIGAWIVDHSGGRANALFVDAQGRPDLGMANASSFVDSCTGCTTKTDTWPSTDFLNPIRAQQKTQALVRANPNADYLVWPTDGLPLQPVVQAISAAGRSGKLALASSDVDPPAIPMLQNGSVAALTSLSQQWLSLATVDAIMRGLVKESMPSSDAWGIGIGLIDARHAPSQPSYAAIDAYVRARFDFVTPYEQAWGIRLG